MQLLRVAVVAGITASAVSCGSNGSKGPSPISPSAVSSVTSTAVTFSAPHAPGIRPGEVFQLRATASFADGTTADCTDAATWTSSDEKVVKLTGQKQGEFTALGSGAATIAASCGVPGQFAAAVLAMTLKLTPPPGHIQTFTIGEESQLYAVTTYSDGSTGNCSAQAAWTTRDPSVAALSNTGLLRASRTGETFIVASCFGQQAELKVWVGPGVRITGAEGLGPFLLVGDSARLFTKLVDDSGQVVRDCTSTAVWATSDKNIVKTGDLQGSRGMAIEVRAEGAATITAYCDGVMGQLPVLIGHFTLTGTVYDETGAPLSGVTVSGLPETQTSDSLGRFAWRGHRSEIIRFTKPFYQKTTVQASWNGQPTMTINANLTPVPNVFRRGETQICLNHETSANDPLCRAAGVVMQDVIDFQAPASGTLTFTAWGIGSPGSGSYRQYPASLTCNGVAVSQGPRFVQMSSSGESFSIAANPSCNYRLTIAAVGDIPPQVLPYSWALSLR